MSRIDCFNLSGRSSCQRSGPPGLLHNLAWDICPFLQGAPQMELCDGYRFGSIGWRFVGSFSDETHSKWFQWWRIRSGNLPPHFHAALQSLLAGDVLDAEADGMSFVNFLKWSLVRGGAQMDLTPQVSQIAAMSSTFMLPFLLLAPTLQRLRVLCNLGMASPWLAAAVTAQVLMGSLFVYNAKFTTELNLFYSLGDNGVFLTMRVWCKTAHAIGACLSSFLGPLIYSEAWASPIRKSPRWLHRNSWTLNKCRVHWWKETSFIPHPRSPIPNCHPSSTPPGVACGSFPGGHGRLRHDLRRLQRLLRLPCGAGGHGQRGGRPRAASGEEARHCMGPAAISWWRARKPQETSWFGDMQMDRNGNIPLFLEDPRQQRWGNQAKKMG